MTVVRQRLRLRTPTAALLNRAIAAVLALALAWYGLMLVLLAFDVSAEAVEDISAYRTIFDGLARLGPEDADATFRLIVGLAGFGAFVLFALLVAIELPRPSLARHDVVLRDEPASVLTVRPRAVERAAELAASGHPAVSSAAARYDEDELVLRVRLRRARDLGSTARQVQLRAIEALARHGLPPLRVHVTIAGYDRNTRRELN